MNWYAPPSRGAGSGRPSGERDASCPGVGRSGGDVGVGGVISGAAAGRSEATWVHGHVLGPTRTDAPRLSRTTSGTTRSARRRVRPRRRRGGGGGAGARQGSGPTRRP